MGYRRLRGNEEEILEAFFMEGYIPKKKIEPYYPNDIKSFERRGFIAKVANGYAITPRGKSVWQQYYRTGRYWVMPLKTAKTVAPEVLRPIYSSKVLVRGYARKKRS